MLNSSTFWAGLLWLPTSIGIMVWDMSWPSFIFFMVGIIIYMGGAEESHTVHNYRLGGPESHTSTIDASPFHCGFAVMVALMILTWIAHLIIRHI